MGRGSGLGWVCRSFGVGLLEGLGGVVGWGLGVVDPGFFFLVLKLLSCSLLFFLPSASTFLWKTEGILAATVFILLPFNGVLSIYPFYFKFSLSIGLLILVGVSCGGSWVVSSVGVVRFLSVCFG